MNKVVSINIDKVYRLNTGRGSIFAVIFYILKHYDCSRNQIELTSKLIVQDIDISISTAQDAINELIDKEAIIKLPEYMNMYMINQEYFDVYAV